MEDKIQRELTRKGTQLGKTLRKLHELEEKASILKNQLADLLEQHVELEGKSRYFQLPDGSKLRGTWPELTPTLDWDAFMRDLGPELFASVCKVKSGELDVEAWEQSKALELVTDSQLSAHMGDPAPRRPTVTVDVPKKRAVPRGR